jgi:hypothetical protein
VAVFTASDGRRSATGHICHVSVVGLENLPGSGVMGRYKLPGFPGVTIAAVFWCYYRGDICALMQEGVCIPFGSAVTIVAGHVVLGMGKDNHCW